MEIMTAASAFEILRPKINPNAEELWVLGLNSMMQVVCHELVFRGTANLCLFHPRDIFRILILNNACSFLVWHNHPSGGCLPSPEDLLLTRRLSKLSKMMLIPLEDHLIVSCYTYVSLAELGVIKNKTKRTRY